MSKLTLILCYARSGGTIINRYLSSRNDFYFLSEINPLGFGTGSNSIYEIDRDSIIQYQMKNWYNIEIQSTNFKDALYEVIKLSEKNNKFLFIRDWSIINFYPRPENEYNPSYNFEFINFLNQNKIQYNLFAFVRNAIDVWISRNMPPLNHFSQSYGSYLNNLLDNKIKYFKYEDFVLNNELEYVKILKFLNIPFKKIDTLSNNVFGDVQNKTRTNKKNKVIALRRKEIPLSKINELKDYGRLIQLNNSLGYDSIYSRNKKIFFNTTFIYYLKKIKNFIR